MIDFAETKNDPNAATLSYSPKEELLNTLTHAFGLFLSFVGGILILILVLQEKKTFSIIGGSIYSATMILLYASSTLYHGIKNPTLKRRFKMLDHFSIYLFISGCYAPFCLTMLPYPLGLITISIVLGVSFMGIIYETFFIGRNKFLSALIYLAAGYPAILVIKPIWQHSTWPLFVAMMSGAVAYTVGVVFYVQKKIPYHHAIWHIFVILGSLAHFVAIYLQLSV